VPHVIMFSNYDSETVTNADSRLVDWLQGWRGGGDVIRDCWTGIALVSWCMWLHRNDIVSRELLLLAVVLSKISRRSSGGQRGAQLCQLPY
jgi:hypothetical protein